MFDRSRAFRALLLGATLIATADSGSAAVQLIGTKSATFSWSPASGPVAGYYVIVSRNGGPPLLAGYSLDTSETITGDYGDTIVLQVAAYNATGVAGPLSPPSQPVTFSPPTLADTGGSSSATETPAATASAGDARLDFSGDGNADLLVRDAQTGATTLWVMDGSVVTATTALPAMPLSWSIVGTGDYDADGTADILWAEDATGSLLLWNMSGGVVGASSAYDLADLESQGSWAVVGSADFNGDGRDEIALMNRILGALELLAQDAAGDIVRLGRLDTYRGAWNVAAAADLDGDGYAEIVWQEEVARELVSWQLDGPTLVAAHSIGATGEGWRAIGSGDHDGDGKADLVVRNVVAGRTQLWFMDGASRTGVLELPAGMDATWSAIAVGADHDSDGHADLAWSHAGSGQVSVWFSAPPDVIAESVSGVVFTAGTAVVAGYQADDTSFRRKLCSGDFTQDGAINLRDFGFLKKCVDQPASGACEAADVDSDGVVDQNDFNYWSHYFNESECANGF